MVDVARREVEQLRSEVRQQEAAVGRESNQHVLINWLQEAVEQLQREVRTMQTNSGKNRRAGNEDKFPEVRGDIADIRKEQLSLRVREEKNAARLDDIDQQLKHVQQGETMALQAVRELKLKVILFYQSLKCLCLTARQSDPLNHHLILLFTYFLQKSTKSFMLLFFFSHSWTTEIAKLSVEGEHEIII